MYPFRVFDWEDNNNSKIEGVDFIFAIEYYRGPIQVYDYTGKKISNISTSTYNLPYITSVTNTASSITLGQINGVPIYVPGITKPKIIYRVYKKYLEQVTNKSVKYKI
jgi:hypothetical protein